MYHLFTAVEGQDKLHPRGLESLQCLMDGEELLLEYDDDGMVRIVIDDTDYIMLLNTHNDDSRFIGYPEPHISAQIAEALRLGAWNKGIARLPANGEGQLMVEIFVDETSAWNE